MALRKPPPGLEQELDDLNQILEKPESPRWQTYRCKLVTPMFGGGVKPGEVDKDMPIRAAAIRGQLRFWWRVACGPFANSQEMFQREAEIWGGIGAKEPKASKVEIKVTCRPAKDADLVNSDVVPGAGIKYAYGPYAINGVAKWLKDGYEFDLHMRCCDPAVKEEAELALRWWASFGGVGARTRRGFGVIQIEGLPPITSESVKNQKGELRLMKMDGTPDTLWKQAANRLFEFRQGNGTGRKQRTPTPSRSLWPEPDQIRRFAKRDAHGKHMPEHSAGNVFPRAAFGLPITFEFKGSKGEPDKSELLPEGDSERMASPLILRPYWDGSKWRAAALLLPGWKKALTQKLKFRGQSWQPAHWPTDPAKRKNMASHIKPMQSRGDDPLSAFMTFFAEGAGK